MSSWERLLRKVLRSNPEETEHLKIWSEEEPVECDDHPFLQVMGFMPPSWGQLETCVGVLFGTAGLGVCSTVLIGQCTEWVTALTGCWLGVWNNLKQAGQSCASKTCFPLLCPKCSK